MFTTYVGGACIAGRMIAIAWQFTAHAIKRNSPFRPNASFSRLDFTSAFSGPYIGHCGWLTTPHAIEVRRLAGPQIGSACGAARLAADESRDAPANYVGE